MANSNSAAKRNRQNERRRIHNKSIKSRVRTGIKQFLDALEKEDAEAAKEKLHSAESMIDSAARKGIYHKNTAARTKSRLHKRLNALKAE